jgi:hypothetical protein
MSKKNVIVQAHHVIFDDKGQQLSPGFEYSVNDSDLIERYISQGFLGLIPEVQEIEKTEETKKNIPTNKNSKTQETVSTNPTGEL